MVLFKQFFFFFFWYLQVIIVLNSSLEYSETLQKMKNVRILWE